jgi:hypothetical protein
MWLVGVVLIGAALVLSATVGAEAAKGGGKGGKGGKASAPSAPEVTLPDDAAKAIKDAFPNATTGTVKMANDGGMLLYSVALWEGANEKAVNVSADGTIAGVATPSAISDIPEAAAKAIRGADDSAIVIRVSRVEVRAEVKQEGGVPKLVKCDKPKTAYEGVLAKGGQTGQIKVAEDGTVLSPLAWESAPASSTSSTPAKVKGGKGGGKKKS